MSLGRVTRAVLRNANARHNSTIAVDINNYGIASVFMGKRPVNAIDTDFLVTLNRTFRDLDRPHIAGVILASSVPNIFSAGLDVRAMSRLKGESVRAFVEAYYDCWQTLYEFPLPTAAAITGHAPALGCLLATLCEHRVMVTDCGTIGLNEVTFGLAPDRLLVASLRRVVSPKVAEAALLTGRLFTAAEALQIGLVDEVATDRDEALAKCESFVKSFAKIEPKARGRIKVELRRDTMRTLCCPSKEELVMSMTSSVESINKAFAEYSEKLKK